MKTTVYSIMATFIFLTLSLTSCGPSEPEVTYMEEHTTSDVYYPNFGGSTKYYTLYDANKKCSKSSIQCFVVTKTNQIINSADRCDKCNKCWYAHFDK